ncbi:MAG TPA: Ig-like domain-containing protein [Longimicrobium sp.]|nr:Ig-like domain-containing protein [Longimicrobium sp.]
MQILRTRRVHALLAAACLLLAAACEGGGGTPPRPPFAVTALPGVPASQSATAGASVPVAPAVRVTDEGGRALADVPVTFAVALGGGSVAGGAAVTDGDGIARAGGWTLGTTAGANVLTATVAGLDPVVFTAQGTPGPPASLVKAQGDAQTATVGSALPVLLAVRVDDQHGNAVPGVAVSFAVTAGGAVLSGTQGQTDAQGRVDVLLTLGPVAGNAAVTASAAGLAPVTFTALGVAGPASTLAKAGGDNQQGVVGSVLADSLTVRAQDAHGNPIAGIPVAWAVTQGGGSVSQPVVLSSPQQGFARVRVTLGTQPGTHTVTASAPGLGVVTFIATANPGPAAAITRHAGDAQTALAGTELPVPPAVRLTDAHGNPVEGAAVAFAVGAGGGTVTGGSAVSDEDGIARPAAWTLGAPGPQTLTATVAGLPPVTFTAFATDPCAVLTAFSLDTEVFGSLTTTDCVTASGAYMDGYLLHLPAQTAVEVSIGDGGGLHAAVEVRSASRRIELFGAAGTGGEARRRFILPAGPYPLNATTFTAGQTGSYVLGVSDASAAGIRCGDGTIVVPRVVVQDEFLPGGECASATVRIGAGNQVEEYFVDVLAGQTLTVTLASSAFDPYLVLVADDGTVVAQDDNGGGGTTARIAYTSPTARRYRVEAVAPAGQDGAYTLTVEAGGGSLRGRRR